MEVERLLTDLRSPEWEVAARAASALRDAPGAEVTEALISALANRNLAVTDAATVSLVVRNEPGTADRLWQALADLDEEITEQMWMLIEDMPDQPVSQELERRYSEQR